MKYDLLGRPVLTPAQKRAAKRAETAAYAKGLACYEQLQALLQAGDLAGAVRAINPFQAAEYHTQAIQAVALAQVQAGELLAAVATAQRLPYADTKGELIGAVVQGLVQRGDIAAAQWLAATVTGFRYVDVMKRIAEAQQQAGDTEAARRTLIQARERAEGFSEGDMKRLLPVLLPVRHCQGPGAGGRRGRGNLYRAAHYPPRGTGGGVTGHSGECHSRGCQPDLIVRQGV